MQGIRGKQSVLNDGTGTEETNGRLLIVDDEERLRKLLLMEFRKAGYACEDTYGVEPAKNKLGLSEYDILITDKNMRYGASCLEGGLELLRWSRVHRPDMGVIVITGYATAESAIEVLKQGATDYVMKPFDVAQLLQRVDRVRHFQRSVNPEGVLGLYASVMQQVLNSADGNRIDLEDNLNQVRAQLDHYFHVLRIMESSLIEQRQRLAKIASCAAEAYEEITAADEQIRAVLEGILAEANRRL